jgi:hypothetical protein
MTPVFCCGAECGVITASGTASAHWQRSNTNVTISTVHRSGDRSLHCQAGPGTGYAIPRPVPALASSTRWVGRCYVIFATSLPSASIHIIHYSDNTGAQVYFNQTDSKIYARVGSTSGASGVSVTADVWYRIDFDFNCNTAGNDFCDVQVDGTACGQATATGLSVATTEINFGTSITSTTHDLYFDDIILSNTAADYPIGAGYVNHFVPTADGTHNIAGTGDFLRTLTGTDILNATTTAYQLVDDVPLETGASVDWINMAAPTAATQYVECIFGPAPGISTPTTGPRSVDVVAGIHQSAAGTTGNMEIRMNDNGTTDALYSATGVAGVVSVAHKRKHYAAAIAGGGAWVAGGGGNGDFTDLRVRFGSPAVVDVAPDQYFDCIMIEAEFAEAVAGPEATPRARIISRTAVDRASTY